jgi:hypothetical protein
MIKIKMFNYGAAVGCIITNTNYRSGRNSPWYVTNIDAGFYKFSPEPVHSFELYS